MLVGVFLAAPLLQRAGVVALFDWNGFHVSDGHGPPGVSLRVSIANDSVASLRPLTSPDTMRVSDPALVQEARTRLEFGTRRWSFLYVANAMLLPSVAAVLLGVYLLRSFLADILAAEVFTRRNAKRLSKLGWPLIVAGVAGPQLEHWRAWMILKRIQLNGAALSPASSAFPKDDPARRVGRERFEDPDFGDDIRGGQSALPKRTARHSRRLRRAARRAHCVPA